MGSARVRNLGQAAWIAVAGALIQGACGEARPEPDASSGGCSPTICDPVSLGGAKSKGGATGTGGVVTSGGAPSGGKTSAGGAPTIAGGRAGLGGSTSGGAVSTGGADAAGAAGVGGVGGSSGEAGSAGLGGEAGAGGAITGACAGIPPGTAGGLSTCSQFDQWTVPSARTPELFVMMDRSSSMLNAVPNSNPPIVRWDGLSEGIATFVADPRVQQTLVALGFFGASEFGADDAVDCNVTNYATPKVDFTRIAGSGTAFSNAMANNAPAGLTPTLPALTGAIQHATERRANSERDVSVVLLTDGYPTQCQDPVSIAAIADVARAGYDDARVRTFVIGLAAAFNLDTIAQAGRTSKAILLNEAQPAATLNDALIDIATTRAPCEFPLEVTPQRPETAWLRFTPQNGEEVDLPNVGSAAGCLRAPDGGFYYDNSQSPSVMKACPCTCDLLKTTGSVMVIVGNGCK